VKKNTLNPKPVSAKTQSTSSGGHLQGYAACMGRARFCTLALPEVHQVGWGRTAPRARECDRSTQCKRARNTKKIHVIQMASGTLPQKNALKRQLFSSISQQQLAQELPHLHHNISFHARKAQFSCTLDNENCFQAHVKSIPNHHGKNIEKWNTNPPSSEHTY
jgi:hypothetical protein